MTLRRLSEQDYYQVLEVDYSATAEEIRVAFQSAREIYGASSLVSATILSASERRRIFHHITEAYNTLVVEESRRQYDRSLATRTPSLQEVLESGPKPDIGRAEETDSAPPKDYPHLVKGSSSPVASRVELGLKEEATGSFLRSARESCGLDLRTIADETKIGVTMLRDIEQERLDRLPAPVYLRNFVLQIARYLGLDEEKVASTYLARVRRLQSKSH